MAYLELDRVYVRRYIGYPGGLWLQSEPRLENAISATQSIADGGTRPDSSAENYIKGLIYGTAAVTGNPVTPGGTTQTATFAQPSQPGLLNIETQLTTMWPFTFATKADEADVDTYRGMVQLRAEGRRMCHALAVALGMKGVRRDAFGPGTPVLNDDPFRFDLSLENWRR
jgi:hypothetical protein